MSYSTDIKNEINNIEYSKTESIAELSAIINIGGKINKKNFVISTENVSVARRIYKLIKDLYHVDIETEKQKLTRLNKSHLIEIIVEEKKESILKDLSLINSNNSKKTIPKEFIIAGTEEKKAYLRGVFLISGSINDPKTARYHMNFLIKNKSTAYFVNDLLNQLNFNSKVLKRENKFMVYVKESEKISDFIKLLNAYNCLFYYEDIRIYRDNKNTVNRLNNCDQANIEKVINSSNELLQSIEKLLNITPLELLDEKLKQLIIYKKKYPESSMTELAEIISSETGKLITKSGINHRIRKLKEMLEK